MRVQVFVKVVVSVQYYVESNRVKDAFYKLTNPAAQMTSFVYDVVRYGLGIVDVKRLSSYN